MAKRKDVSPDPAVDASNEEEILVRDVTIAARFASLILRIISIFKS